MWFLRRFTARFLITGFILGSFGFAALVAIVWKVDDYRKDCEWDTFFPSQLPPLPYDPEMNGDRWKMDDPELVRYLQEKFLIPPSANEPVILSHSVQVDVRAQKTAENVLLFMDVKTDGFFVECGAVDGETDSNTLWLEKQYKWTGLLVEADPINFGKLAYKKRKTHISPSCLGINAYPTVVSFQQAGSEGKITEWPIGGRHRGHVDVQCFPLYTYLLALDRPTVDYLSLSVGGWELEVLKTIPWSRVNIRALSVSCGSSDDAKTEITRYLAGNGYYEYKPNSNLDYCKELLFIQKNLVSKDKWKHIAKVEL